MASGPLRTVIQLIRRATLPDDAASSDGALLRRFVARRDDSAFAVLVERHGPMVLGVCRRVLKNPSDVEDAFQAAFIVLACKARSITRPEVLASWLYRVAYRVALRCRVEVAARRERQASAEEASAVPAVPEVDWADLRRVLDAEIDRLPEKYRIPVVLCYLEGMTNDEAARRLGCAKGTICSRLAWARERLRTRLTRRGVTLTAGLLASVLTPDLLSASVPAPLIGLATDRATSFLLGQTMASAAPTAAAALAKGVLRAMFLARLRTVIVLLSVLGLLGAGVGMVAPLLWAGAMPPPAGEVAHDGAKQQDLPQPAAAGDDKARQKLADLLKERRDVAAMVFDHTWKRILGGQGVPDNHLFLAALRLHDSELDLCRARADHIKACEAHLQRMKEIETVSRAQERAGKILPALAALAVYYRLDAEIRLEREKAK
jgi:RNA polymerase sigma factor (sigma-70 family)